MLHYNEQSGGSLNDLVHLYNVWMANNFKDVEFATNSFHISDFGDLVFLENFNCDLLLCEKMDSLFNFAEGALTKCLRNTVTTNDWLLLLKLLLFWG